MSLKKLFCSILLIGFVSLLFSQDKKPVSEPTTETEATEVAATADDDYVEAADYEVKKSTGNFLTKFFTTEVPFKEYDEFEVYYKNTVTKLKKGDSIFAVYKSEDLAGFGVQMTACYYYTFFDTNTRKRIISAGQQYLKDFEEKKLVRKSAKTIRAYDKINAKVRFGSLKSKANNTSNPIVYLGYSFVNKSPYFQLSVLGAENERYNESPASYPKESYAYNIYLTKAQLTKLMELLSDDNVNQYLSVPAEKTSAKKNKVNQKAVGDEY